MRIFCLAFTALFFLLGFSQGAIAQSVFAPAGLQSGDPYRLVFITNGSRDGTSEDIDDYNGFVNLEANRVGSVTLGISDNWTAIASTPTFDAIFNTATDPSPPGDTGVPLYLVDGITRFADHYDEIWPRLGAFSELVPLDIDQFGNSVGRQTTWTGTNSDGLALSDGLGGTVSGIGSTRFNWIANGGQFSTDEYPLFGISPVLTAVPEPGASLVLASVFCTFFLRRNRKQCTA